MPPRRSGGRSAPSPPGCPGVRISEHLPRLAARMDRVALVRSVHHDAGADPRDRPAAPPDRTALPARARSIRTWAPWRPGCSAPRTSCRPSMVVPGPITNTGVKVPHGQSAGWLGAAYEPFQLADDPASPGFDPARALDRARRFLDQGPLRVGQVLAATAALFARPPARGGLPARPRARRSCATLTGETRSARAACWPGGWSNPASAWSR